MNDIEYEFISSHVYRRLHSGDLAGAEEILRGVPEENLPQVAANININLGLDTMQAKGSRYAGKLLDMLDIFMDIYQSQVYSDKLLESIGELDTYPKYQKFMVSLGKDPLTYHEWVDRFSSTNVR